MNKSKRLEDRILAEAAGAAFARGSDFPQENAGAGARPPRPIVPPATRSGAVRCIYAANFRDGLLVPSRRDRSDHVAKASAGAAAAAGFADSSGAPTSSMSEIGALSPRRGPNLMIRV